MFRISSCLAMVKSFIFPLLGNGNNNLCLIRFWFRLTAVVEKQLAQYQALQWTVVIVLEIQLLPRQSISVLNSSHTYMQLSFCLLELSFCLSVLFGFTMFYYFPHVHGSFFLFLSFLFFFFFDANTVSILRIFSKLNMPSSFICS